MWLIRTMHGLSLQGGRPQAVSADRARNVLMQVLKQTGGNKAKAARLLQIDYKTIRTKAKAVRDPVLRSGS